MTTRFSIDFLTDHGDISVDTLARGIGAYVDFTANVVYAPHVQPYCPNPIVIRRVTEHAALVVAAADDSGCPIDDPEHTHTIPFEALAGIEIL